ncbi:hypothetical protein HYDPIDRAFT_167526 [Hydnomerulius pinastri MD-312]|uniref:Uncharacterized protein n=1 Tax=Hydnomerulius pinastri MD-312 TaxID=994086 RepID=A0A0C9WGF0_9AGAM|nr:hypothetical protein HYDPIDRAFT_167526 [Hydnomerulius pinastri MD-312]
MSPPANNPFEQLSPAEQAEFCRCFPRAGFWLGTLPPPPDLAPYYQPEDRAQPHAPAYVESNTHTMERPFTGGEVPPPPYSLLAPATCFWEDLALAAPIPPYVEQLDFWDRVCVHMDLDPAEAKLGYKYSVDRAGDFPRSLANEHDLHTVIEHGQGLVRHARSRKIEVMIHNLKPAVKLAASAKNMKSKEPGDSGVEHLAVDFMNELHQLKEHLACATHSGHWCFVSPIDGHHKQLDIFVLTLWAKKMPQSPVLVRRQPSMSTLVISLSMILWPPSEDDSDDLVIYPGIEVLLHDLDQVIPAVSFLQYQAAFIGHEIFYVDGIEDLSHDFLTTEIGLPRGVIKRFKSHAARLIRRAEKSQGGGKASEIIDFIDIVAKVSNGEKENAE